MADEEARKAFEADPAPEGLASARIAVEHLEHHGQTLRHIGSSYDGDVIIHRFACRDWACRFRVTLGVALS